MNSDPAVLSQSVQGTPLFGQILSQLLVAPAAGRDGIEHHSLPSWSATVSIMDDLRDVLLMSPGPVDAEQKLTRAVTALESQIDACSQARDSTNRQPRLIDDFVSGLPHIRDELLEDTETALRNDPAVSSREEVLVCYPGLRALACYRIAHLLHGLEVPLLPRLITEIGHSVTGIDIHPGARIGKRFFIDHGTGVVIGATCIIGDDVKIYQGVTLGARSFPTTGEGQVVKGLDRHPIIGDRVTIYAGATILGRIHIGSDSVIGGNVWITRDVPGKSRVMQHRPKQESFINGAGI